MFCQSKKTAVVLLLIIFSVVTLSSCETLRKKFTRKRKKKEPQEEMIISPRDYSAHPFPSDVLYKQYFVYWKSWNQELITSLNDGAAHKKIVDCAAEALMNLKKMASLLNQEQAGAIEVYVKKTEALGALIIAARNVSGSQANDFRYQAERILSAVNKQFDLSKMKTHLRPQ